VHDVLKAKSTASHCGHPLFPRGGKAARSELNKYGLSLHLPIRAVKVCVAALSSRAFAHDTGRVMAEPACPATSWAETINDLGRAAFRQAARIPGPM
jgi:hypothetical protein